MSELLARPEMLPDTECVDSLQLPETLPPLDTTLAVMCKL
jgi:hypothetical protein